MKRWNTVKQIAGFPKKKTFSNLVIEDQVVSGQQLADKINNTFISVTRDLPPLRYIPSSDNQPESIYSNFPINLLSRKKKCIPGYLQYHLRRQLDQMKYRIGY